MSIGITAFKAGNRAAVAAVQAGNPGVHVSPMTAWEIATLVPNRGYRPDLLVRGDYP
jgi:hypothetical protein